VIGLDVVVGIPLSAMPRRWQQLLQHHRIRRCLVGYDFAGSGPGRAERLLEEPMGGLGVPARGDKHVDDLPELVDRSVHVAPSAGDLHIGLVDLPAVTDGVAAGPGSLGQQWREPLDPPVDRDVVDLDPALGKELFDIAVGEPEA
jgi:hypothetical protein